MAFVTLDTQKLKKNFHYLDELFTRNNIQWSVVTKLLSGNKEYIKEVLDLGIRQISDSRVSNLRTIKEIDPTIETIYIKPPPRRSIPGIVMYADISMNTEIETIRLLSKEAKKQGKAHKIIIMIEMGELREGVMRDDFIEFYSRVFEMENIEVVGLGTNLTCMYGVLPSNDKLIQLCLYEQLIEAKFSREIKFVSGGSSVTIPLIFQNMLPMGINHFRVGETFFLGNDLYNNKTFEKMENNAFQLFAEIIELNEKPIVPTGEFGQNVSGESIEFDDKDRKETSYRGIIDMGLLDIEENHIKLKNKNYSIVGASSDMLVVDLGKNKENLKVGDLLEFEMDYMGTLRIMNSKYVDKRIKRTGSLKKKPAKELMT